MFLTREYKNSLILSLILFPTGIVVSDINLWSTKVIQWVPSGIVRHHWKEIDKSETLAMLFPEPPVVAFRRPKNIKDTLVRAVVSRPSSTVGQ
jgi:hypothetical protein